MGNKSILKTLGERIKNSKEKQAKTKYERAHTIRVREFHKKIGIDHRCTPEEIDQKTLEYVKNTKNKRLLFEVYLTDKQYENCDFLLELYQANPFMAIIKQPREEQERNVNFMVEYLKVVFAEYQTDPLSGVQTIEDCLSKRCFEQVLRDPAFLEKLSKELPEENVVKYISKIQYDLYEYPPRNRVEEMCSKLSKEFFQEQISRFGAGALKHLPPKMLKDTELISFGIQYDGFDSLKFLDIESVLDNKNLIMQAAKHDGSRALNDYIDNIISPNRKDRYWCHGELHEDRYFSRAHKSVHESLKADPEIQQLLETLRQEEAENNTELEINN